MGNMLLMVLTKEMDPALLDPIKAIETKGDFKNPWYLELLIPTFYHQHICRLNDWPEPLNPCFKHANEEIYTMMQGPSEFGIGGQLATWDIKNRL